LGVEYYSEVQVAMKTTGMLFKGRGTVLLVDDEEVVREVGKELLEAMGYTVLLAGDGREALEVYREHVHRVDIILLDLIMPRMGGGETYDRIKKINPEVKVLLSSGYTLSGQAAEILERGCDGFIQKPFSIHELSARISQIMSVEPPGTGIR